MNPPDLLSFTAFGGDWPAYETALHSIFIGEIARGGIEFGGVKVNCRRQPEAGGDGLRSGTWCRKVASRMTVCRICVAVSASAGCDG